MSTEAPDFPVENREAEQSRASTGTWQRGLVMFFAGEHWQRLFDLSMNKFYPETGDDYSLEQLERDSSAAIDEITEHVRNHLVSALGEELDRRGLNPRVIEGLEEMVTQAMEVLMFRIVYGTHGFSVNNLSERPRDMDTIDAAFAALEQEPEYWMPEERLGGMPPGEFRAAFLVVFRRPVCFLANALPVLDRHAVRNSLEHLNVFSRLLVQRLGWQWRRDRSPVSEGRNDLPFLTFPWLNQFVFAGALAVAGLMITLIVLGNFGVVGSTRSGQQRPESSVVSPATRAPLKRNPPTAPQAPARKTAPKAPTSN